MSSLNLPALPKHAVTTPRSSSLPPVNSIPLSRLRPLSITFASSLLQHGFISNASRSGSSSIFNPDADYVWPAPETYVSERAKADDKEEAYRSKWRDMVTERGHLEATIAEYLRTSGQIEQERISLIKSTVDESATARIACLRMECSLVRSISIFAETIDPERECGNLVKYHMTGFARPVVERSLDVYQGRIRSFRSRIQSPISRGGWGISVQALSAHEGLLVPTPIAKSLSFLSKRIDRVAGVDDDVRSWVRGLWKRGRVEEIGVVEEFRKDVEQGEWRARIMKRWNVGVVIQGIKMWIRELPDGVAGMDWESVTTGYLEDIDEESRLSILSNHLNRLAPCQFHTLAALCQHWYEIEDLDTPSLHHHLAPLVLPHPHPTLENLNDDLRPRIVRDLITKFELLFPSLVVSSRSNGRKTLDPIESLQNITTPATIPTSTSISTTESTVDDEQSNQRENVPMNTPYGEGNEVWDTTVKLKMDEKGIEKTEKDSLSDGDDDDVGVDENSNDVDKIVTESLQRNDSKFDGLFK